ncbi:hypothetical protein HBI56_024050 [Parastagonospora nodorum]|nr:hypothetical protein HBH54_057550 [Parastagonospora nodorum]KAH3949617.1 hypothetical protein HBH53_085240 [Parastagonospora nodorum]KAH3985298.1 hypothetical protein HBH52_056350 [Parastagonospora nodorum]KAH4006101.1 hypothetical protein HBI10_028760 [Parastagonospora nodorum]KAH4023232.1 hypothetical protein HBI13_096370 [Parastagonospora nodorum]
MDNLNAIACEPCRSKKCKCDRKLPICSQCLLSPLSCRYAEGGKRGLPAAYMNSIEKRLQDTEAALYATLRALQDMDGLESLSLNVESGPKTESRPRRSKAEKQKEWMQRPLQTSEDILTWFRDEQQRPSTHSARKDAKVTGEATAAYVKTKHQQAFV